MERLFRSLKNEWEPVTGYINFSDAAHAITAISLGITARSGRIKITVDKIVYRGGVTPLLVNYHPQLNTCNVIYVGFSCTQNNKLLTCHDFF
ncbi:hypothetical protein A193_02144 [Escherichia coli KTE234]|nr:hypothetical protein A193_02144 [Escherichia coli KTE234]EOV63046.1 hypothetical protein A1U1_01476 [Escherichia coli KTE64]GCU25972.1 IS911 transposase [Escherichia coli]